MMVVTSTPSPGSPQSTKLLSPSTLEKLSLLILLELANLHRYQLFTVKFTNFIAIKLRKNYSYSKNTIMLPHVKLMIQTVP